MHELILLRDEALQCTKCPLSKSRNKLVFGEGNPDAGIFMIGEGPGYDENEQGRPFVGRSGQLLDKILNACGFNRQEHIYIGNIVKCRPPGNRNPSPEEAATCMPYLMKQIEIVDPKIIILLGATALKYMIDPDLRITKIRGQWTEHNGRLFMPVYHPSALLRNPALKKETWEDYKNVVRKYRELVDGGHECEYV
ncbi:MAG: uracil-DNA glycosylase [Bacteroidales bacterium]|nr:uracil-DNA glycosylase [Bacteroidales bacterium]